MCKITHFFFRFSAVFANFVLVFTFQAVCQNNIKSVKFLLECGVDLSVRDLYGFTPLRNAELLRNKEMVEILQSHVATKISAGN